MVVGAELTGEALAGAKVAASEHVKLVRGAVHEVEEQLISAATSVRDTAALCWLRVADLTEPEPIEPNRAAFAGATDGA